MLCVGANVGALTVKAVALRGNATHATVVAHHGRPLQVLDELLAGREFAGAGCYAVSGPLGDIPEVAAIQRALAHIGGDFDAVASLGGESFLVYVLAGGRITNALSHNRCAAGSGEFFVQQVGRMGFDLDAAIRLSFEGRLVPLASRCSVHCKSDITHKLNRHEATPADILRSLHDSMADKVVALLERIQREPRRVLLVGGVTRNARLVAALREKFAAEFVVLPESAWFEAWGTALLARDAPHHKAPHVKRQPGLGTLPPLHHHAGRVQIVAAPPRVPPPAGSLVLAVDAGSTTTKAVLLDPATRGIVASHYTRTQGDPVTAARDCLRAIVHRVGNRPIGLVGTTGSARELVGAWLGTGHVYNEISAHAAGATHVDADVDTIFEIGGQDSKYIYLRNGVPIDYAMNNACSAGTGSFLEESALGDLGVSMSDIAEIALAAPAPVQFKTTCAAFINSDIRIAQQQGHAHDNIVAGLVYAVAANYLAKVKGQRYVGKKVFLQGGVALNAAVGHAFAHSVGRQVVIPPNPELLGAVGVGLMALERSGSRLDRATDLAQLAAREMTRVGRFTCRACRMSCTIERFDVGGRRFPFGGRCSLFERVWKRAARRDAPDLVEQRAELIFGPVERACPAEAARADTARAGQRRRVGIPRALTTHSLFPLYATFFAGIGMDVVLSQVDPAGDLKSYSGFCFPAQIAHGAVLDLARRGVGLVFLPHVVRMPHRHEWRDSYLCPITQGGPYYLAKAFPDIRLLSPVLDFSNGYAASAGLVDAAVRELGTSRAAAERAWTTAVRAQVDAEEALSDLGHRALAEAVTTGTPTILLAGRSYNAFTPEASQSVGRKLASMGVTVIPADCLAPLRAGPTPWHFANQVLNAVALSKQHANLFLLCVSNFSCTIDAFTHSLLASELGSKPYLIIEIDAHTADAGVQTRLEAFLDIIRNHHEAQPDRSRSFTPCRLAPRGRVVRANGESLPITDRRVKVYVPNFSHYHSHAFAMAARCLGLHPGDVFPLDRQQLDRGLQHTSGRECLPLPISIGQLLQVHENRQAGEIAGFYMVRGGAPCVVDSYYGYMERFIAEQQLPDLFLLSPEPENDYAGFDATALAQHVSAAVVVADILVEIDHVLRVVGGRGAVDQLREQWQQFTGAIRSLGQLHHELPGFVARLAALPRTDDPRTCPRVVVTGDFFTRFSPFFMDGVCDLYAERGIILKPADLSDLFLYVAYHGVAGTAHDWGLKPGALALVKACVRAFQPDGKQYLRQWAGYQAGRKIEEHYRNLFLHTGLLVAGTSDVSVLFEKAAEYVSPVLYGETIPTVGQALAADREGYDGIIVIGPFNCLPFRISEAILKPLGVLRGVPILTYESDGYAVSPSVLRQVEVHIQQVLERAARTVTAR